MSCPVSASTRLAVSSDYPVEANLVGREGLAGGTGLAAAQLIEGNLFRQYGLTGLVEIRDAAMAHQEYAPSVRTCFGHGDSFL
jgi:hypothetical protein